MNWQQVCEDPSLQDLPYKIELNEFGQIVLSPASNDHGSRQTRVAIALSQHLPADSGEIITECSIATPAGTKVADVAWCSPGFLEKHPLETTPFPAAPEICVEIVSPSNSQAELALKRGLYFSQGAREVWFVQPDGRILFMTRDEETDQSRLVPGFPTNI